LAQVLLLLCFRLLLRKELLLEKIRSAFIINDDLLNVKEEEGCLRKILFGERWFVPFLNLLQIENGLPLGVRLIGQPHIVFSLFDRLFNGTTDFIELLGYYSGLSSINHSQIFVFIIEVFVRLLHLLLLREAGKVNKARFSRHTLNNEVLKVSPIRPEVNCLRADMRSC